MAGGLVQELEFVGLELQFDDLFDAVLAEFDRYAEEDILQAWYWPLSNTQQGKIRCSSRTMDSTI